MAAARKKADFRKTAPPASLVPPVPSQTGPILTCLPQLPKARAYNDNSSGAAALLTVARKGRVLVVARVHQLFPRATLS